MLIYMIKVISESEWEEFIVPCQGFKVHTVIDKYGRTSVEVNVLTFVDSTYQISMDEAFSIIKDTMFNGKDMTWFIFDDVVHYAEEGINYDSGSIVGRAIVKYKKYCNRKELLKSLEK